MVYIKSNAERLIKLPRLHNFRNYHSFYHTEGKARIDIIGIDDRLSRIVPRRVANNKS